MFGAMIADWRSRFKVHSNVSFNFVNLLPGFPPDSINTEGRPAVRMAQLLTQTPPAGSQWPTATENAGMAVGIDLGGSSAWG